eukprot:507342-Prymnesium_polylepis.1
MGAAAGGGGGHPVCLRTRRVLANRVRPRRGWQTRKFLCDRQRRQSMENVWEQRMGSRPIANGGSLLEKWPAADGQLSRWRENKTGQR